MLGDPQGAIPPYDAMILLSPRRASDRGFRAALAPLVGAIDLEAMRAANLAVDRDATSRRRARRPSNSNSVSE